MRSRRVDAKKKEPDDLEEETEVHRNQTLRAVTWVWVIVRPTTLRTSTVYSKVSVKGTIIMKNYMYPVCSRSQLFYLS